MEALNAILSRKSSQRLVDPVPQGDVRKQIFSAALRAPAHARLRSWRFLVVEGEALQQLGRVMADALREARPQSDPETLDRLAASPLRAPMVIVLVARIVEHPKVPRIEQLLSLACAVQNMQLAAHALGFGSIWRTGDVTYVDALRVGLGLPEGDQVAGFLYLGTPEVEPRDPPVLDPAEFFVEWPANGG